MGMFSRAKQTVAKNKEDSLAPCKKAGTYEVVRICYHADKLWKVGERTEFKVGDMVPHHFKRVIVTRVVETVENVVETLADAEGRPANPENEGAELFDDEPEAEEKPEPKAEEKPKSKSQKKREKAQRAKKGKK